MVHRVWQEAGLKPHRLERYLTSDDPDFERKAADVIGLYWNPPQHAAVFCVDEKTAIQALDRLDPVLPLSPGRAGRHGFEYYRHGMLSLYAALDTKTGRVHGKTAARHTSADFVDFLRRDCCALPAQPTDSHHSRQSIGAQNPGGPRFPGSAPAGPAAFQGLSRQDCLRMARGSRHCTLSIKQYLIKLFWTILACHPAPKVRKIHFSTGVDTGTATALVRRTSIAQLRLACDYGVNARDRGQVSVNCLKIAIRHALE